MDNLKNTIQERKAAVAELRELDNAATGRSYNAAEVKTETDLRAKIERLDRVIDLHADEARTADIIAGSNARMGLGNGAASAAHEARSFGEWAKAAKAGDTTELRELSIIGGTPTGGDTVPTRIGSWMDPAFYDAGLPALVTRVQTDNGAPIDTPVEASFQTLMSVVELAAYVESNPVFATVNTTPQKLGALSFASREVMEDSEVAIASVIASGFAKAYGTAVEAAIVNGTLVTGDGLTGVAPTSTTAAADAVTGDELIQHFYAMDAGYRNSSVWLMSANSIAAVRSLKDSADRYLLSGLEAGMPTLLGRPVLESTAMADMGAGNVFASLVDPSVVIFHEVRGFEVERSDSYRWANDVTSFKGSVRLDAAVGVPAGVANLANA